MPEQSLHDAATERRSLPWPDDDSGPVSLISRAGRSRLRLLETLAAAPDPFAKEPSHDC